MEDGQFDPDQNHVLVVPNVIERIISLETTLLDSSFDKYIGKLKCSVDVR